jgi:hypothetical protein
MIVDRHAAPIETSSPAGVDRLLWQAMQFSEWANSPAAAWAVEPALPRGRALGPQRHRDEQRRHGARHKVTVPR